MRGGTASLVEMTMKMVLSPAIVPTISAGFARLLSKMCVKDKNFRYSSWEKVLEDSHLVQSGGIPEPLPPEAVSSIKEDKI